MIKKFFGRPPEQPQQRVVTTAARLNGNFPPQVAHVSALRRRTTATEHGSILIPHEQPPKRGMWVSWQGRTGVLTNLEAGDVATVMLVDDQAGLNVAEVHVPSDQLRQAWYEEIPEGRRPPYADAVRFGYHARPT